MHARASSGCAEIVEGTGQPSSQSGTGGPISAGAGGGSGGATGAGSLEAGAESGVAIGTEGGGEIASPAVHGCSSVGHAVCVSSESVHTTTGMFYHRQGAMSPLLGERCGSSKSQAPSSRETSSSKL